MQRAWTIRSCGVASLGSGARIAPAPPTLSSRRRSANCRPAAASLNRVSAAAGRRGLGALAATRHSVCAAQGWRDLHKALTITTSLRATAVTTTLCGFPSFRSRSAKTFKSLL